MAKKQHSIKPEPPAALRTEAEARLHQTKLSTPEEMIRLVHELSVHQIALEMQREELQLTGHALEDSLKQYTDLYENAPVGYLTITRESRVLQANLAAKKMLPLLMHKPLRRYIADESSLMFNKFLEDAFSSIEHKEAHIAFLDADTPEAHHVSAPRRIFHCDALVGADGAECRLTLSDITDLCNARQENTQLQEEILTEAAINRSLINSIPGIFYLVDQTGLIIRSNDYLRSEVIGNEQGERMEISGLELVHPADREKANEALQRAIRNESGETTFEGRVLLRGGSEYRWFVVTTRKVTIGDNPFLIGMGIDITEHKQLEKTLVENEDRFRKLFESHAAAKLIIDPKNGSIVDANQAAADLYGWPIAELCEMRLDQIQVNSLPPGELQRQIESCVSNKEQNFTFRNRIADGSIRDVEVFSNSIEIEGKPLIYSIIIDITERKRLEALADSILTVDLNGAIVSISNMGLDLYGTSNREELLGRPFASLLHNRDVDAWKEALATVQREKTAEKHEFLLKRKNNSICAAEITLSLIEESEGVPQSYLLILRDISQRKLVESELLFKKTLTGLGEMAAGIAHEIYQPINTIGLVVDKMLVNASKYSDDVKNDITTTSKKLHHNIERIETIVETIRSFAGKESKKAVTVFDSNTTVRAAMDIDSLICTEKSITLDLTTDNRELPVSGNIYKFEQLMLNLIRNSIDALEEKKKKHGTDFPMNIHIHSSRDSTSVVIRVQDNGIGISPEELDYIKQPFYTTKTPEKGTGLGLSISQGIVKEMQGTLSIESKEMEGTTVTVTVPLKERRK